MKKKLLAVALSALTLGTLFSCNNKKNDPNTLVIEGVKLGYGVTWMEDIISAYKEKTGVNVSFSASDGQAGIEALQGKIEAGGDGVDIFFSKITDFYKYAYQGYFADVTDIWQKKDGTTGKSIEDRTSAAFKKANKIDDKYISFSWANGIMGFVRNDTLWTAMGFTDADIPYTTDEMVALCNKVVAKNYKYENNQIYPLVYSYEDEYYTSVLPIWFAQYEGSENMAYFDEGIDPDDPEGSKTHHVSSFFNRDGITAALEVVNELLVENSSFHHPRSKNYQFETAQNDFLKNRNALFMVNGSWLDTETNVTDYNASFISTPIVSSIIDSDRISTISDDATLSATVKYVKGVTTSKPEGVSDDDIAVIRDAVTTGSYQQMGFDHQMVISANSTKIDLAKGFLEFMYSDEGLNIFHKAMNGGMLGTAPSNGYSDTGITISSFKQNVNSALNEGYLCSYTSQVPAKIFCYGGINRSFANGLGNFADNCVKAMVTYNKTPREIFNLNYDYIKRNWANILNQAGLK